MKTINIQSVINGVIVNDILFCAEYNAAVDNNQLRAFLDACFPLIDGKYQVGNDTDTVFNESENVVDPGNTVRIIPEEIVNDMQQGTVSTFVLLSSRDKYIIERELFRTDSFCSWSSSFMFKMEWELSKFEEKVAELDESDEEDCALLSEAKDDIIEDLKEFSFALNEGRFSFPEKLITKWDGTPVCDLVNTVYKDVDDICNDNVSYK